MSSKNPRKPTHPGEFIREEIMPELNMSQGGLARAIGRSRLAINELLLEKRGVSTDMALRLGRVFGTTPEFWLNMQQARDLWEERQANRKEYERLKPLPVKQAA